MSACSIRQAGEDMCSDSSVAVISAAMNSRRYYIVLRKDYALKVKKVRQRKITLTFNSKEIYCYVW